MRTRWPSTATADQYDSSTEVHLVSLRPFDLKINQLIYVSSCIKVINLVNQQTYHVNKLLVYYHERTHKRMNARTARIQVASSTVLPWRRY